MMRGWVTLVVSVLTASACDGGSTAVELDRLQGSWEWRSATGGIAGLKLTPATTGYTMELRFLPGGRAEAYRNEKLEGSTGFHREVGKQGGSFPGMDVVRFDQALLGGWEEMGMEISDSTLVLADGCCDGFTYSFTRIAAR